MNITKSKCDKYLDEMAKQCFYSGYIGKFEQIEFEYDGLTWEFVPYFGPQIWVRPKPPGDAGHPKARFFGFTDDVAKQIMEHFDLK